ncbi:hypothetical protein BBBOND_0303290 [Babesia bigemina]|uniref:Uncharacterized protein n=1 Tax=Babesia bigemina TaxID=5866 RepID=A0A061DDN9_BABBI|nr:hypothetical protein BBBOND_0303290 [Babesia bigemina]CDR96425.1 hypothetical protein BBBOND_0303290 [Babesia bigemina]|eukprot:XP_012768611.1 hypothetical protein BBBOND_0303290 [Babesia bigemina]
MVYNSLTEAPRNLKEGIDWLVAVKGTDAESNIAALGEAVHKFLADKPVGSMQVPALEKIKLITKEFIGQKNLKGSWFVKNITKRVGSGLGKTYDTLVKDLGYVRDSDYQNVVDAEGVNADTIVENLNKVMDGTEKFLDDIKNPNQYTSAYSSKATWEASCAKDPEACAVVLVGIAPMLYTGLRHLRTASSEQAGLLQIFYGKKSLMNLLNAAGYNESECRSGISAGNVVNALRGVNDSVLYILYDLAGFWAFY